MRSSLAKLAVAAAAVAGPVASAHADPFDRRHVPADAKWVAHFDVDVARETALWKSYDPWVRRQPGFDVKVEQVAALTGMHFPDDLHDVTLYGRAAGDDAVVVIAHARMDRRRMSAVVRLNADSADRRVGNYDVVSWVDKGVRTFGAFHDDGTVVLSRTEANVTAALDVLDGRAAALPADGPLAGAAPPTTRPTLVPAARPAVYAAVVDVPSLTKPDADVPGPLRPVDGGSLSVAEVGPSVVVRVNLTAKTDDAADQLRTAADGVRAIVALAAAGPDADPMTKSAADLLRTANLGRVGRTVTADLSVPVEKVREAIAVSVSSTQPTTQHPVGVRVEVKVVPDEGAAKGIPR